MREDTSLSDTLEAFLESKAKAGESGNYRRNAERVVGEWIDWATERGVATVADVDVATMRRFARRLDRRVRADAIAASTAHTYYSQVRAFLTWCVREGLIEDNPAEKRRAVEELPDENDERSTQQFWSPEQRERLVEFVDRRAREAIEASGSEAVVEARDRALVVLLAYSGVRAGEVLRDPNDERRTGLRWGDLDLQAGTVEVLGKSQEWEVAQLPRQACGPIDRYRTLLDPPGEDWPVFPTRHRPTLYRTAREGLEGFDAETVESMLEERDPAAVLREHDLPPPNITTTAARTILKDLCEAAEIDVDGEYLKPHGARRGLGETLYREAGPSAAQRALRHRSPETTAEAYAHIEASELAEDVGDVLEDD